MSPAAAEVVQRPLIAVLDYGIGNLRSAEKALQHVGADARLSSDPGLVADAAGVVLPGVGSFGRCMEAIREARLDEVATDAASSGRPFLGICVGMQMLYERSEEAPGAAGLAVIDGTVRRLPDTVKRPQIQWNRLHRTRPSALLDGLDDPVWMYFVHSYAPEGAPHVVATCDYGGPQVAAVELNGLWATQFHPEKSGAAGLRMLTNFVTYASARRCGPNTGDR